MNTKRGNLLMGCHAGVSCVNKSTHIFISAPDIERTTYSFLLVKSASMAFAWQRSFHINNRLDERRTIGALNQSSVQAELINLRYSMQSAWEKEKL